MNRMVGILELRKSDSYYFEVKTLRATKYYIGTLKSCKWTLRTSLHLQDLSNTIIKTST